MKLAIGTTVLGFLLSAVVVEANNSDVFNYGMTDKRENGATSFGQKNWDDVTCSNLDTCAGFPNKYPYMDGYDKLQQNGDSNCRWCPADKSVRCGLHRQSPIDLKRDRGIDGHPNEKECPDWHWMQYKPDTCSWDDMKDQFTIERHALQIHTPQLPNGDIDCFAHNKRRYPRLDYSKGFPDWWWLQRTDVMVPSQHIQEGVRYAAEITLAHFYEIEHVKNQLGHIAIFMQDYPDAESWPYLDKLICQWRKEEDKVRAACGLDPVEPYGRCALLREQAPTEEWLQEAAGLATGPTTSPVTPTASPVATPTKSPVAAPTKSPVASPTSAPVKETPSPTTTPATPSPTKVLGAASEPTDSPVATPTLSPVATPTVSPVAKPTASPVATPTVSPVATPTASPVATPTASPVAAPTSSSVAEPTVAPTALTEEAGPPPSINCRRYGRSFMKRVCDSTDPCCDSTRADTNFCWDVYDNVLPGSKIESACYHCCDEPKIVGKARPIDPAIPKTIECSAVDNPFRMCKDNSCCSNPRSRSEHCQNVYALYGDHMDSICHYCCREKREVGRPRNLRLAANQEETEDVETDASEDEEEELEVFDDDESGFELETYHKDYVPEGAKVVYSGGQKYVLRPENFEEDEEDEEEYFHNMYTAFKERNLNTVVHDEDYANLEWFPYEWLIKVGTEYYYRYEGTMLTPPCWEVVHWRAMKDPIRVHERQIKELHRLLAWRLNPDTCTRDTAGVVSDDGNTVDLSREVMYYESPHRKVFCECKDWPSKFPGDQEWCEDWKQDTNYDRFYKRPYSFDSGGKWHPDEA